MTDHRVEVLVSFTVHDGTDGGREAAEGVFHALEYLAEHGQLDPYTTDVTVTKRTVDGNDWATRWPPKCQGRINLCSLTELGPVVSAVVCCDVPAGQNHPTTGDGEALHRYRDIYWGARSVPEDSDHD